MAEMSHGNPPRSPTRWKESDAVNLNPGRGQVVVNGRKNSRKVRESSNPGCRPQPEALIALRR